MSFVKHAIFVANDAPELGNYEQLSDYIFDRISKDNIIISEGVCDALDHSSPSYAYGGKLGIDCTSDNVNFPKKEIISDEKLFEKIQQISKDVIEIKQYKTYTKTPLTVLKIKKTEPVVKLYEKLKEIKQYTKLLIFVDDKKNNLHNPYMLIWRVANNIDAKRDVYLEEEFIGINATDKNSLDGYEREWPGDTDCDKDVIESLQKRNLVDINKEFLEKFYI